MRRSLNKIVAQSFDDWKAANRPDIYKVVSRNGFRTVESSLFACIEVDKKLIGYLITHGLDPFKRGTKEPMRCAAVVAKVTREEVEVSPEIGKSIFD